ncbi:MAG: sugar phosphate isomerase/epimerase [Verrucomicrobiota bacterium]|jgi:sugar phosphate isomerase/epimerase|nr:sugar phosphate isomerase/epimerase [Verrucomicrobiota bacterium]
MPTTPNTFPKLHNATWPGVVGKGPGTPEPAISLDTLIDLTAAAEVNGAKFDGIDAFLCSPHVDIDSTDDDLKRLAEKTEAKKLAIGSLVAPVWSGCAFGGDDQRAHWLLQVRKACAIGRKLRDLGARPYGLIRIDSSGGVADWAKDPAGNTKKIIDTFSLAADIAEDFGERLAAEGEICWGGMHSWRAMLDVLEGVGRPKTVGFQADMAHSMLYLLGYNAPEARIVPENFDWSDTAAFQAAYLKLVDALRPWTLDFHVAQNDGTVKGQGSHDKTGRHCLPNDPNAKLDIVWCAGQWLKGAAERGIEHLCWDGCMFTNDVMTQPATWNSILGAMLAVRDAHGWSE